MARLPTAYVVDPHRAPPRVRDARLVPKPRRPVEARIVPFHIPRVIRAFNRVLLCALAGAALAAVLAAPPAFLLGGGALAMVYRS